MKLPGIKERLALIDAENSRVRALTRVDRDEAIESSHESERRMADGKALSPLEGVTFAVKDNLAFEGKPWTAGIEGWRNRIAERDSEVVAKLRAAGAVLIGSANMEEAALGAVTDNRAYGRCINPLGEGLTPGGSSGGSGAAVAARFTDLAIGTDTMGSVRVPATYCGISGIKPTAGAVSNDGLALLCPSLDTIGPMARDTRLLWPALRAISNQSAVENWAGKPDLTDLSGLTFGVPVQLDQVDCEPAMRAGLETAIEAIRRLNGSVERIDLNGWDPHRSRRAGLLVVEAAAARELADLIDEPGAITENLRSMLVYGRDAPTAKVEAAQVQIDAVGAVFNQALDQVDAILMPTTPQQAFPHGSPVPANQADLTAPANFAGCPAVALPLAVPGAALPASVQLMSRRWSDPALLAWAEVLSDALD